MNLTEEQERIFERAIAIDSLADRSAFLEKACESGSEFRQWIEKMLEGYFGPDSFLPTRSSGIDSPNSQKHEGVGSTIGRYKLLQQIGEGGFGIVYMAEQRQPVSRKVALKIIKLGMDTKQVVARFESERQALALMNHPNIAQILDGGCTSSGRPYFVMELVNGISITKFSNEERLSTNERLQIFLKVCDAIQHAHQKGVIHRDLKPSNILITLHGGSAIPKIIDFGIAKAVHHRLTDKTLFTQFQQFIGTPAYMSPEQANLSGLDIDTRSDVYSLGVLLYELLVGQPPFDNRTLASQGYDEIRRIIREEEIPLPSASLGRQPDERQTKTAKQRRTSPRELHSQLHGDLDWVVMKAVDKDRTRRYESAQHLADDLGRFLDGNAVEAVPPSRLYLASKFVQRHTAALGTAAAFFLVLVIATVFSATQARRANQANSELQTQLDLTQIAQRSAETNAALATELQEKAAENLATANETLVALWLERGRKLFRDNRHDEGLAWYTWAARKAPDNKIVADSLVTALLVSEAPRPLTPPIQHQNSVYGASASPDGRFMVTASRDGTGKIWDIAQGKQIGATLEHDNTITEAKFSPDGKLIATASLDGTARIWDARTGLPKTAPLQHDGGVNTVSFHPTGSSLLTGSRDGTARLWQPTTGLPIGEPLSHSAHVYTAEFSNDGRRIVTSSLDHSSRVWDFETRDPISGPLLHPSRVYDTSISNDGSIVLTSSPGSETIKLWSSDGALMRSAYVPSLRCAALSPDGSFYGAGTSDGHAILWDTETGSQVGRIMSHPRLVQSIRFSPEGHRVLTSSHDGAARLWDAFTGAPLCQPMRHQGGLYDAQFSPDGTMALTVGEDMTARAWDIRTQLNTASTSVHQSNISSLALSPDAQFLAVGTKHGTVSLWNQTTGANIGAVKQVPGDYYGIATVAFSPDGTSLLVRAKSSLRVFETDQLIERFPAITRPAPFSVSAFSPDGTQIATGSYDGVVQFWNSHSGDQISTPLPHKTKIEELTFSPDSQYLGTASYRGECRIYELQGDLQSYLVLPHPIEVNDIVFSPTGELLATASRDGKVRFWKTATGELLGQPLSNGVQALRISFAEDADFFAVSSYNPAAQVWQFSTRQMAYAPLVHDDHVHYAKLTNDGSRLVTRAYSPYGTLQTWDTFTGLPVGPRFNPATESTATLDLNDEHKLMAANRDHLACVYELPDAPTPIPSSFLDIVESMIGVRVSPGGRSLERLEYQSRTAIDRTRRKHFMLDYYHDLASWCLDDSPDRTMSPRSQITVTEHYQRLLHQDTPESLHHLILTSPTNGVALARLAQSKLLFNPSPTTTEKRTADLYVRLAEERAPMHPDTLIANALVHLNNNKLDKAIASADTSVRLAPENARAWHVHARVQNQAGNPEQARLAIDNAVRIARTQADPKLADFLRAQLSFISPADETDTYARTHLEMLGVPPRSPKSPANQLDLSLAYTHSLSAFWDETQRFNLDTLSQAVEGENQFSEFDLRGIIHLPKRAEYLPHLKEAHEISINQSFQTLRVIHAARDEGRSLAAGTRLATYEIRYNDGSHHTYPIEARVHISDFIYDSSVPAHKKENTRLNAIWNSHMFTSAIGTGTLPIVVFETRLQNPHPQKTVHSIQLISAKVEAAVFILAITLEP